MKKYVVSALMILIVNFCNAQVQENLDVVNMKKLGYALMEKSDFKNAAVCFEKALKIDPQNPLNYFSVAQANYFSESYNKSITACDQGLKLDPNETLLYLYRGMANIKLNNLIDACEDLNKTLGLGDELMSKYCK